jgi:outer membrane immunogenic protein
MKRLLLASAAAIALSAPALAADLSARMPVKAPAYVAAYSWTGFYLGVNVGGAFGNVDESLAGVGPAPGFVGLGTVGNGGHLSGVIGGGQIGYNWQTGNLLFGVEADFQGSGERGDNAASGTCGPACTVSVSERMRWFGTARGRVGYAADRWLFYVTGGGAWQNLASDVSFVTPAGAFGVESNSATRFGWTLGGGVETALWANWTGGVEYLYIDTGNFSNSASLTGALGGFPAGSTFTDTVRLKNNIVRAKLNYRF